MLRIASVYLMLGLGLGVFMGATHSYELLSVHSHIGLLGWTAMAISGLVYLVVPGCSRSGLAKGHYWLLNLGLPLMISSLVCEEYSLTPIAEPLVGVGSVLVASAFLLFTLNIFMNINTPD